MRKILFSFLLATTAVAVTTPALAQQTDREKRAEEREERRKEREEARKERSDAREARSQQGDARNERVEQRQNSRQQVEQRQNDRQQARDGRAANVNERGRPTLDQRRDARNTAATQRQQQREQARQQRQESREQYVERVTQPRRIAPPAGARPDRPAPPPRVATNSRAPKWNHTWRRDNRYDWRRYRDRNRSAFRLGFYFDPFGWNYRRYGIGWRLWPAYYSNQYWLDDPYRYRLPYAPWPYKWVRYYNDAMLVNTFTGEVVDVMYDFFW